MKRWSAILLTGSNLGNQARLRQIMRWAGGWAMGWAENMNRNEDATGFVRLLRGKSLQCSLDFAFPLLLHTARYLGPTVAIDVWSEISSPSLLSPQISFSHDLKEYSDVVPVEEDDCGRGETLDRLLLDFDFDIYVGASSFVLKLSSVDEILRRQNPPHRDQEGVG
ncbi:hypothetical protein EUGRSUZ_C02692 [Eucalyptus grandis]|uniref:Uncharacterized protein n=2 Tax=Eucalyptus grandis TaxID=71139 RepID=A0ACC3LGS6_EUCGR|nr:hypothetical protein EUGRSUZ_C02692 [Eucalyptus grandis]